MKKRILVVENDLDLQKAIVIYLQSRDDCSVKATDDGTEAIKVIDDWKPDLTILDVDLGEGEINGIAIAKYLDKFHGLYMLNTQHPKVLWNNTNIKPWTVIDKIDKDNVFRQLELFFRYGGKKSSRSGEDSFSLNTSDGKKYSIQPRRLIYAERLNKTSITVYYQGVKKIRILTIPMTLSMFIEAVNYVPFMKIQNDLALNTESLFIEKIEKINRAKLVHFEEPIGGRSNLLISKHFADNV